VFYALFPSKVNRSSAVSVKFHLVSPHFFLEWYWFSIKLNIKFLWLRGYISFVVLFCKFTLIFGILLSWSSVICHSVCHEHIVNLACCSIYFRTGESKTWEENERELPAKTWRMWTLFCTRRTLFCTLLPIGDFAPLINQTWLIKVNLKFPVTRH
jgi:hypothetical protein